jgi:hypothetical protein
VLSSPPAFEGRASFSVSAVIKSFFQAVGLSTPFLYAAFTYWLFHWLDKKASAKAKRAFSKWLAPKAYCRQADRG